MLHEMMFGSNEEVNAEIEDYLESKGKSLISKSVLDWMYQC